VTVNRKLRRVRAFDETAHEFARRYADPRTHGQTSGHLVKCPDLFTTPHGEATGVQKSCTILSFAHLWFYYNCVWSTASRVLAKFLVQALGSCQEGSRCQRGCNKLK
jgi:hypothetical protein